MIDQYFVRRLAARALACVCFTGFAETVHSQGVSNLAMPANRLALVENGGQWPPTTLFAVSSRRLSVQVLRDGLFLCGSDASRNRAAILKFRVDNARTEATPIGIEPLSGTYNFFVGHDGDRWSSGLHGYQRVEYAGLLVGVDLAIGVDKQRLQLSLDVAPGVALADVVLSIDGVQSLESTIDGGLVCRTEIGSFTLSPSVITHSTPHGTTRLSSGGLVPLGGNRVGITAPDRDPSLPLAINTGIDWMTYLGGSSYDNATSVGVAPNGDIVVAGRTESADFPLTPGVVKTALRSFDLFVSRLTASGDDLVFSTFMGGSGDDQDPAGIGITPDGAIILCGSTYSPDFPVTHGAYDEVFGGEEDMFALKLSADGATLNWSTFFGDNTTASIGEHLQAMALAPDASVYIAGYVQGPGSSFPVTPGAYDSSPNGASDVIVSHISADGTALLHSTFLGGSGTDRATGLMLQPDGVVVVGRASSPNFPVTAGAYNTSPPGGFVTKLDLALSQLVFSTILKGLTSGSEPQRVATDPSGNITVTGRTVAPDFPVTPGAFDMTWNGDTDAFVTRLNATGTALIYSTYLGGGAQDGSSSLVVDSAGVATIGGGTWWSSGFPVTAGAFQVTGEAWDEPFISRLSPDGKSLWYSTLIAGNSDDTFFGAKSDLALLPDGSVVFVSVTQSTDFPVTPGAYDPTLGGIQDAFVSKLSMLPQGVTRYGSSTAGCGGYMALGVTAMPEIGGSFSLTCNNVKPSSSQGILAIGLSDLSQPLIAKGAQVWVDPTPLLLLLPMTSNSVGFTMFGATLPSDPGVAGAMFTAQVFWPDVRVPSGPLAASNALAITIQP